MKRGVPPPPGGWTEDAQGRAGPKKRTGASKYDLVKVCIRVALRWKLHFATGLCAGEGLVGGAAQSSLHSLAFPCLPHAHCHTNSTNSSTSTSTDSRGFPSSPYCFCFLKNWVMASCLGPGTSLSPLHHHSWTERAPRAANRHVNRHHSGMVTRRQQRSRWSSRSSWWTAIGWT